LIDSHLVIVRFLGVLPFLTSRELQVSSKVLSAFDHNYASKFSNISDVPAKIRTNLINFANFAKIASIVKYKTADPAEIVEFFLRVSPLQ